MRNFLRKLFRLLFLLILLGVAVAAWLLYDGNDQLSTPLVDRGGATFTLAPGTRLREAVQQLRREERLASVRQGLYLEAYGRWSKKAGSIKAGEYRLDAGVTPYQALDLWASGKVVTYELRIVEGTRFDAALAQVLAHPQLKHTLPAGADAAAVMGALGFGDQRPEGRFFPDTYTFPRDTADVVILRRAFEAMNKTLDAEWQGRAPDLPYARPEDALTMASIVEKETGQAAERPLIAGVFVRRLKTGMRLQTDPTVIYGLGSAFDGNLRKADLLAPNPFNTYLNLGLPPTPICLPGRAALHAALHPADGRTLYFVSRGDGTHQFSETLEEHEAAVRRFQLHRPGTPAEPAAQPPVERGASEVHATTPGELPATTTPPVEPAAPATPPPSDVPPPADAP